MKWTRVFTLFGLLLFPVLGGASPDQFNKPLKPIQKVTDKAAFLKNLRINGHRAVGGIDKARSDRDNRSFPHFSSSFIFQGPGPSNGVEFPFTMVGFPPASGRTATFRSVIIPLRMSFVGFEQDVTFEPDKAVQNIIHSPMYQNAQFKNGVGQFGDMMQRAAFFNKMDRQHRWHVLMDRPRIAKTVDIRVESDIGELIQVGDSATTTLGNVRFGFIDSTIHTILQFANVQPDELPVFVTYNVFADALGFHDAFAVGQDDGTDVLQTLIYTSWLEEDIVGDLLSDVSTFNHELLEWMNDPFVNNIVPTWLYPPSNAVCSDNPFLEVGDPQGNGPEFFLFPTVAIPLRGFTYHLQDLVLLQWFTGETPSSAQNGWFDFPDTTQITTPGVPCPQPPG